MEPLRRVQEATRVALRPHVTPGERVALVDYPAHYNVGDLMIYAGEVRHLLGLGARIAYVASTSTYDPRALRAAVPDGPVFLHGGGNFGNRWGTYQRFREQVIADFTDRPVVQLPQTMEWTDAAALARAQAVYGAHPRLTLLLRDHEGAAEAARLFEGASVAYCPDSAFGIGAVPTRATSALDVLVLKRTDNESLHDPAPVLAAYPGAPVEDWWAGRGTLGAWWAMALVGLGVHRARVGRTRTHRVNKAVYDRQARLLISRGVRQLARTRTLVTDRLHAGVLAVLLGRPVVLVDNENHKIARIFADYLGDFPGVRYAPDFEAAVPLVGELLGQAGGPAR